MSVKKRPNDKWRARYRDPSGRERAKHFDRKVDAENWVRDQQVDMARGVWLDPRLARRTFGDYVGEWRKHQLHHRPNTTDAFGRRLESHILPVFKDRQLGSIRRSDVQAWVTSLSMKPESVRAVYGVFRMVMKAAVTDGILAVSPCLDINLPTIERRDFVLPTKAEIDAVAMKMKAPWQAGVWLAASTGVRQGELLGLTVDRVDFLGRTLRIDRQLQNGELVAPKTASSVRTIPLADSTLELIAEHMRVYGKDGLLFTDRGQPIRRQAWGNAWRSVQGERPFRFHDLRHYYASLLISAGVSVRAVQEALGHSTAKQTLDVYGHLWPGDSDRTRAAIERTLRGAADHSRTEDGEAP